MADDGNLQADSEREGTSRRSIDWEAIEREYRTGQLSVREIGKLFGVSHVAIVKRAQKNGWTRDLASRVRRRANEILALPESRPLAPEKVEEAVEGAAVRVADIVRAHRKQIGAAREVVQQALDDLGALGGQTPLAARASVLQGLANAMKSLIALERQAFNMDAVEQDQPPASEGLTQERRRAALALLLAREIPSASVGGQR